MDQKYFKLANQLALPALCSDGRHESISLIYVEFLQILYLQFATKKQAGMFQTFLNKQTDKWTDVSDIFGQTNRQMDRPTNKKIII